MNFTVTTFSNVTPGVSWRGDGTTIKGVNHETNGLTIIQPDGVAKPRFLGVTPNPSHTTAAQISLRKKHVAGVHAIYNASPRGQLNPIDSRAFVRKGTATMGDHVSDQVAGAGEMKIWKIDTN